ARIAEAVAETGMRAWPVDGAMRTVEDAQRTTFPGLLGGAVGAGVLAMLAWALAAPPLVVRPLLLATIALALPGTLARAWKAARDRRVGGRRGRRCARDRRVVRGSRGGRAVRHRPVARDAQSRARSTCGAGSADDRPRDGRGPRERRHGRPRRPGCRAGYARH